MVSKLVSALRSARLSGLLFPRFRKAAALLPGLCLATLTAGSFAQTPTVLPNTVSSVAGNTPTASTANAACPTNGQFTATDVNGNGCPAVNAVFGGNERSMVVDAQGNIYTIADTSNPQAVRRIDARTGNIAIFAGAGGGNSCNTPGVSVFGTTYTQTDKLGDGCPVSLSGGFNGGRGLGLDPYGNLIITTTGDNALHFVCNAVSPICTAAQARVQLMRNIAGCTTSITSYGTAVTGTTVGTAGDGTNAVQVAAAAANCTTGVAQMRQAAADKWDNVYFADNSNNRIRVVLGAPSITVNGATLANPLYAVEQAWVAAYNTANSASLATPTQGFLYPAAGGATACSAKTDAGGDGCPFYQTAINTSSYIQGLALTPDGDFLFADGLGRLRTIYMGGTAIRSALAANGISNPVAGTSYALIGNGTGTSGVTGGTNLYYNSSLSGVYLGSAVSLQASAIQRLAVDTAGNIYIGDQAQVLFYDIYTGYVRRLGGGTTATVCGTGTTLGDGCPIAQALFGAASSVLSVGLDNLGNLYIQDLTNKLIRRASAATLPTTAVNGTLAANVVLHNPATPTAVSAVAAATPDYSASANCGSAATDGSQDCPIAFIFAPKALGLRNDPLTIASTIAGVTTTLNTLVDGTSTGSALVFDTSGTPATSVLGSSTTSNTAVLVDGAGNTYVSGTQGISRIAYSSGTVTNITGTATPYFAVDPRGNVYTTAGNTTSITKYTYSASAGTYTAGTLTIPTLPLNGTATQGYSGPFTVDANGTLYIADLTNRQAIKFNQTTGIGQQLTQTALNSPTALTQDSYGYLLILDGTSLLKVPPSGFAITAASPVANPAVTFPSALTAPTAVAVDQGENIYVADSGSIKVLSLSGYQYTIPGLAGSGVAVDGAGNLYTAQSTVAGVTEVLRNAESNNFGTNVSTPYVGVFVNTGATAATGFSQTDTGGNYSFLAPTTPLAASAPTCNISSTALTGGAICNTSILFSPTSTGSGAVPDVITLLPGPNTIGSLSLNGTKNGSTATTTTTISGNTTGLVYSTGTETTFTVTVTQSTGTPAGSVSVYIDGGTALTYTLTAATATTATATVTISGLTATSHTIYANYAGSSGIAGSTSTTTTFSIAQAATMVNWTPSATTQQYSAALGTGVLDATAVSGSTTIPGVFVYTATPTGGTAANVHSASFLPIGSYSLAVTFYPTDAVDYTTSTGAVNAYTVTKASTTAGIGSTQFLVAGDGTGNFTSVQPAVNALGATGGNIYIKPGTYSGLITVVQPNVSLRGLGGNPNQVILTHAMGSFSNSGGTYQYAGEFQATSSNGGQLPSGSSLFSGDEGSATLVVAKGINTAFSTSTLTPNGFYGENFTLANTYDSDTTTTTTTYLPGANSGTCTANEGPAQTYNYLYNNQLLCASQALAIWTTSDLSVMNNVYTASLQDTVYVGSQGSGSNGYVPARQYWFRGKVTGDVDYIFGDAAVVFDFSSIYSAYHSTATGTVTIEAQNKAQRTGGTGDYLSGYVMNSNVFTSQSSGMTNLYFGRPYGTYSTYIMLNSYVDQVAPVGYIEFSGQTNLPTSTYAEYNDIPYTDPATGSADLNGVLYLGTGGSSGSGVTGTRETTSQDPGTSEAANTVKTSLTLPQAQQYFPTNFLGSTVSSAVSSTTNWNPTAALAANVNAFTGSATSASVVGGTSVTLLMRPQTPGLGAITNGTYTIPTGAYSLSDTVNGTTTTLASGTLDASGEAYFTSSSLLAGTHTITWTYGGDANFSGSTSSTYTLTVTGASTTTTLSTTATNNTVTYGQAAPVTVTVAAASGTPTGMVTLTIDGTSTQTATLSGGTANFSITGLGAGSHTFSAAYGGANTFTASSSTSSLAILVTKAVLTITPACANRYFDQTNSCSITSIASYQYTDSASTVFSVTPTATTTALPNSAPGSYPVSAAYTLSTFGSANYTVTIPTVTFTVTGNTPQNVIFAQLPNFPHGGSYQLTARATSGLAVTYSITAGSGIASISGSTLTVTGTGTVSVTATTVTDTTGEYVQASASSTFTAQ